MAAEQLRSTFHRFANVGVRSGYSGAQAAQAVLQSAGVEGVRIERHQGFLSDHYDPLAAVAVAAHEAGHATPGPGGLPAPGVALAVLASTGIVSTQQESDGVKRVLVAAALTYVAAAAASLLQLIDLVLRQRR
jgi:Zn-dependent membrane protease YugP